MTKWLLLGGEMYFSGLIEYLICLENTWPIIIQKKNIRFLKFYPGFDLQIVIKFAVAACRSLETKISNLFHSSSENTLSLASFSLQQEIMWCFIGYNINHCPDVSLVCGVTPCYFLDRVSDLILTNLFFKKKCIFEEKSNKKLS